MRRANNIYIPRLRSTYNALCGQRTHPYLSLASRLLITSALRKAELWTLVKERGDDCAPRVPQVLLWREDGLSSEDRFHTCPPTEGRASCLQVAVWSPQGLCWDVHVNEDAEDASKSPAPLSGVGAAY